MGRVLVKQGLYIPFCDDVSCFPFDTQKFLLKLVDMSMVKKGKGTPFLLLKYIDIRDDIES